MARKKKGRSRTTTSNRMDYRTGGRVGYPHGGPHFGGGKFPGEPAEEEIQRNIEDREEGGTSGNQGNQGTQGTQRTQDTDTGSTDITPTTPQQEQQEAARQRALDILSGDVTAPTADEGFKAAGVDAQGQPIKGPELIELEKQKQIQAQQASLEGIAPEQVATLEDVGQVEAPEQITAVEAPVTTVDAAPDVAVTTGTISDESLAKTEGVDRVEAIEGAEVEIPEGALTERVIGVLSPEAKAQAAQIAGSSLNRVTRAKKQLRNAGVSENIITELGNDPEALEDALMDLSEAERGVIEGLPEEALVSNQLDTLLKGIEEGEIPSWARPAVSAVESMLAARGLSASSVGRDELFNAIIQSAIPLAQSNAQAIQSAVTQERSIEAQRNLAQAELNQQTALQNAQNVFSLNMAQFEADQQVAISNSKFLQTVGLTEASNDQQAIIQNAVLMSQANLAEADINTRLAIQNAQAFLEMDMTNINNEQQANILRAQQEQQRLLSNQSAQNAAAQFNATSQNQTNQFMANLAARAQEFNVSQMNAAKEFNASAQNAAEARRINNEVQLELANAQLAQQADEFNAQVEFNRQKLNIENAQAIEQSNAQWRRQINLADTAAQNQINLQNVQNAFQLTSQAQAFVWQELRDQADFDFRRTENVLNREENLIATAISSDPARYDSSLEDLKNLLSFSGQQSGAFINFDDFNEGA